MILTMIDLPMSASFPTLLAQGDLAPVGSPTGTPAPGTPGAAGGAATTSQPGAPGAANNNSGGFGGMQLVIPVVLFMAVMWLFMSSGQRKEKRKRAEMLEALQKGAKIETVGGIFGTIVEVREDELVVKVDEKNNTRLSFAKNAVKHVLDK